jgi:hypothetical protein
MHVILPSTIGTASTTLNAFIVDACMLAAPQLCARTPL